MKRVREDKVYNGCHFNNGSQQKKKIIHYEGQIHKSRSTNMSCTFSSLLPNNDNELISKTPILQAVT